VIRAKPETPTDMIDGRMIPRIVQKIKLVVRTLVGFIEQSRTGKALLASARATASSFGQTLHQLWLEVTGFIFLAMAGLGAMAGFREYGRYQAGHSSGPARLILAVCFTTSFAWFGLSSFWRVNKKKARARAGS
jgi:hypothetical protein